MIATLPGILARAGAAQGTTTIIDASAARSGDWSGTAAAVTGIGSFFTVRPGSTVTHDPDGLGPGIPAWMLPADAMISVAEMTWSNSFTIYVVRNYHDVTVQGTVNSENYAVSSNAAITMRGNERLEVRYLDTLAVSNVDGVTLTNPTLAVFGVVHDALVNKVRIIQPAGELVVFDTTPGVGAASDFICLGDNIASSVMALGHIAIFAEARDSATVQADLQAIQGSLT